ncbi:hypothetical protein AB0M46_08205 [Dactylosporangium sp. NPDC051485]|uniref:hypothetical protein n=1 Tax=Dactylosporangium sp. NPDC051485 TaxID=3154846 RepID=UPI00342EBF84
MALRPEPVAQLQGHVTTAESGHVETAIVPAPADSYQAGLAPADETPADETPADQAQHRP